MWITFCQVALYKILWYTNEHGKVDQAQENKKKKKAWILSLNEISFRAKTASEKTADG